MGPRLGAEYQTGLGATTSRPSSSRLLPRRRNSSPRSTRRPAGHTSEPPRDAAATTGTPNGISPKNTFGSGPSEEAGGELYTCVGQPKMNVQWNPQKGLDPSPSSARFARPSMARSNLYRLIRRQSCATMLSSWNESACETITQRPEPKFRLDIRIKTPTKIML